ncbi:MAG: ATP-binding cassette domain-containing protein [Pseudomonadota bacterium]
MIKLIDIEKIYITQGRSCHVLHSINLEINKGEIFGIVGQSGAGKSTLIRCVNLLERPTLGQVWIDNQEITRLKPKALRLVRRQIGMIFQQFNLLSSKTVYENITLPLKFAQVSQRERHEKILSLLELTALKDKQHCYPAELSGGQRQRVAIARALAYDPKILLCDEATSALDPETTQNILQLLKDINQRFGLTILLITHEVDVVKTLCDRIALLDQGRLVEQADIVTFFTEPVSSLAKKFVSHSLKQELPSLLQKRLGAFKKENSHAVLRILFRGHAAAEPLIAHLMREMGIHLNILQANIELLKEVTLGIMVAEVMGDQTPLQKGIEYLKGKGLSVEVMGYVDGSIV